MHPNNYDDDNMILQKKLQKLRKLSREKHHPLIHHIHKKHKISKKTLFYVKEYGPHANVPKTIIRESLKIVLMAAIVSSFGGVALEFIKPVFVSVIPIIILTPILNDMIGNYCTIISSRFSTLLHEKKIDKKWWLNSELKKLFYQIFIISFIMSIVSTTIAEVIATLSNYPQNALLVSKVFLISLVDVLFLVSFLFFVSIFAGLYYFKKKEDPNNFLIPITTSVADLGNMVIITILVLLFF